YPAGQLHYYQAVQRKALTDALQASLTTGDVVLLKASHGLHLEKVLAQLEK
ncbi:UDP-N-acetylmuramoyl-tripeptide--D-alanyl-D-alanine ligase, partial [Lactobacillus salivarius]|nr:UDP-N-acetylmuramoyl-tripeptide--D-alanyl-D-alanine ligase [Ligilactobacillus salivarius]